MKHLKPGQRVSIEYTFQAPIEAVVIASADRSGFVEVEEEWNGSKIQYVALESKCTVIDEP